MKYLKYLREDAIKKALSLDEPDSGDEKPPSETVKRNLEIINAALKQASKLEQNKDNDALVADLRDKKKKWSNVDKSTKTVTLKQEEPPPEDQQQEEPPPEDQQQEEPPPEKEEEEDPKKKKKVPPQFQKKEEKILRGFRKKILEQEDIDPEIAEKINKNFWSLI